MRGPDPGRFTPGPSATTSPRRLRRPLRAALLTLAASLVGVSAAAPAAGAVDAASAQAAAAAVQQASSVPSGWTGNSLLCLPGTESQASLDATLQAVNAFRSVAGLGAVTLDATLNGKALAAALMMRAGNENGNSLGLSHSPGDTWPCATADGKSGAGTSNLALGASGASAIRLYLDDDGVSSLGHRRWVLDPEATTFGTGSTGTTNALAVIGGALQNAAPGTQVAWPPAGAIAASWVPATWSVAVGGTGETVDVTDPQVTMTLDGAPLAVTGVADLGTGYGTGRTVAWTPSLDRSVLRSGYHQLGVSVTGFSSGGAPVAVAYTTTVGTPAPAPAPTPVPTPTPRPAPAVLPALLPKIAHPRGKVRVGTRLTVSLAQNTGRIVTHLQWLRSGRPIKGANSVRHRVARADRGRALRVQVTSQAKDGSSKTTELSAALKVAR